MRTPKKVPLILGNPKILNKPQACQGLVNAGEALLSAVGKQFEAPLIARGPGFGLLWGVRASKQAG